MEVTKLSTKGQIVLPEKVRGNIQEGTSFVVSKQGDLIVLKQVKGLTDNEIKEMKELNKVWNQIDNGECKRMDFDDFMDEIKKW